MLASLSLYSRFDRRVRRDRVTRLPDDVRGILIKVEAGRADGPVFHPTPLWSPLPALIAWGAFALVAGVPLWIALASPRALAAALSGAFAWWGVAYLALPAFLGYYALWLNGWAPSYVARHRAYFYVYLAPTGIVRRDRGTAAFVPWALVRGASLASGTTYMDDYAEGHHSLRLQIEGRHVLSPYLVKGHGPGILFHDWVEYAEADLRALEAAINRRVAALRG